jgi:diguanylate cyclase (GGDEF)-like protein
MDSAFVLLVIYSVLTTSGSIVFYALYRKTTTLLNITIKERDTDILTGTFNRYGFTKVAEKVYASHKREKLPMTVAQIDLDDFKKINDTYGHSFGDIALRAFGEILQRCVRDSDVIGRLGGDEFVVLFTGTTKEKVNSILLRVRNNFEIQMDSLYLQKGGQRPPTVSMTFGVAESSQYYKRTLGELCEEADKSLYQYKEIRGRCEQVKR